MVVTIVCFVALFLAVYFFEEWIMKLWDYIVKQIC